MTDWLVPFVPIAAGCLLLIVGLDTWSGRSRPRSPRWLAGMDRLWLAPAEVYLGVALALFGCAFLPPVSDARPALLGWALVAVAPTALCLVVGALLTELDPAAQTDATARRPGPIRRFLRFLATHQTPTGGPLWPDRNEGQANPVDC